MSITKNSKLAILGNLAQNGYIIAKALQNLGYKNTDLYITSKHGEIGFDQNPYDYEGTQKTISWIKIFKTRPILKSFFEGKNTFKHYDWIIAFTLSPAYAQFFNQNFISVATGSDLREFVFQKGIYNWLLKRAYKKNKHLFFGNHDLEKEIKMLKLENISSQFPGPIEMEKYQKNYKKSERDYLLIFWPTNWSIAKGAKNFIDAMDYLLNKYSNTKLKFINRTKKFGLSIQEENAGLKLTQKYPNQTMLINPVNDKEKLIWEYYEADLIADQFVTGSPGGIAREAMACAVPLLTKFDKKYLKYYNGEMPPILNATTTKEVISQLEPICKMNCLEQQASLTTLGKRGQEWLWKYHSSKIVAEKIIATLNSL